MKKKDINDILTDEMEFNRAKNTKKIIIIVAVLIVLATLGVFGVFAFTRTSATVEEDQKQEVIIPTPTIPSSVKEDVSRVDEEAAKKYQNIIDDIKSKEKSEQKTIETEELFKMTPPPKIQKDSVPAEKIKTPIKKEPKAPQAKIEPKAQKLVPQTTVPAAKTADKDDLTLLNKPYQKGPERPQDFKDLKPAKAQKDATLKALKNVDLASVETKKATSKAKAAPTKSTKSTAPSVATAGFYLQVGAFTRAPNKLFATKIAKYDHKIIKVKVKDQIVTKYLIGPYKNRIDATNHIQKVNLDFGKSIVFEVK